MVSDVRGEVIPGANIFLVNTYDGASSDEQGKFEFETTETGSQLLAVKFIGYKEFKSQMEILVAKDITCTDIDLKKRSMN